MPKADKSKWYQIMGGRYDKPVPVNSNDYFNQHSIQLAQIAFGKK